MKAFEITAPATVKGFNPDGTEVIIALHSNEDADKLEKYINDWIDDCECIRAQVEKWRDEAEIAYLAASDEEPEVILRGAKFSIPFELGKKEICLYILNLLDSKEADNADTTS